MTSLSKTRNVSRSFRATSAQSGSAVFPPCSLVPRQQVTPSRATTHAPTEASASPFLIPRSEEHTSELQSPVHHSFPTRRSSDLCSQSVIDGFLPHDIAIEDKERLPVIQSDIGPIRKRRLPAVFVGSAPTGHTEQSHDTRADRGERIPFLDP